MKTSNPSSSRRLSLLPIARACCCAGLPAGLCCAAALAQEPPPPPAAAASAPAAAAFAAATAVAPPAASERVFVLGRIATAAADANTSPIGSVTLDREQLWDFSKDGVADALNLAPGVAAMAGAGSRNEALISVRGFDRWQVPLMMDGIRLYLPADNRIDFDRFLTPDLAEIQISKGYVSVLNGPDGLGGAVNLVTRKPVKPLESEVRASAALAGAGQYNGNTVYANLGSRQEKYYVQFSAEQRDVEHWRLSENFTPTPLEDGGNREHVGKKDVRFNLKAGFTPNASDEYSINYVHQTGEKHGIGSVVPTKNNTSTISTWDWPNWNTSSLYWLSNTRIGDQSYIKTRAYYNTFVNTLAAYTDTTLSKPNFTSYYDDHATGMSIEAGTTALARQTLKAALHWRRDEHVEWQYIAAATATTPANFTEPKQKTIEDSASLAIEDTWHALPQLDIVAGISHDARFSKQAQDFASVDGKLPSVLFDYKIADSSAINAQAAAIYKYSATGKMHLSISDRTRFPTMFERFSSRFGGAISNPTLKPERALNIEYGVAERWEPGVRGQAAVFYSQVEDVIQPVPIVYNGKNYSQNQNTGKAYYQGVEVGLSAPLSERLEIGGNYTYTDSRVDNPNDATARLTTTPRDKALIYARWNLMPELSVLPNVGYSGPRWSTRANGTAGYIKTGDYALVNVKMEYEVRRGLQLSLAARNLLDKNYQLVDGYPQEGRNFILSVRYQF